MIQFLVTAVIVVIGVFLLTLLLCLMTWVIVKLLRFLFPHLHLSAPAEKAAKPQKEEKRAASGRPLPELHQLQQVHSVPEGCPLSLPFLR